MMDYYPSRGKRNTPSHFILRKSEISAGGMDHLARRQLYLTAYITVSHSRSITITFGNIALEKISRL